MNLTESQCSECREEMEGSRAGAAQDDLYGAYDTLGSARRLAEHIEDVSKHACADTTDTSIILEAMTAWLGYEPVELVRAVRHQRVCPARN